jgi:polyvinyl alcohol dehydrogenase (cytochrome)
MHKIIIVAAMAFASITSALAQQPEGKTEAAQLGEAVYQSYCASCHGQRVPKAPDPLMIKHMTADSVYTAITTGVMTDQAAALHDDERKAVAEFLTGKVLGQEDTDPNLTQCKGIAFDRSEELMIRDWGIDYKNTRYQDPASVGLSDKAPENLEVSWALAFPGAVRVRSQPAFAGGYMYLGSQDGAVYAFDAATGCQHWKYQAVSEVRTSIAISDYDEGDGQIIAVFGDYMGNFYGVDALTGEELWKKRPHDHTHATITGTPRIYDGRAFVSIASHEDGSAVRPDYPCCTFRGAGASVDIKTGETNWITYTVKDEAIPRKLNSAGTQRWGSSGAASWTTPAIDIARNQMYIGTGDNYSGPATGTSDSVIAMDLDTGKINWVFQATAGDTWNGACMLPTNGPNCPENEGPDYDFGSSMVLAKGSDGREVLLAGQKSGAAFAIDPDTGEMLWKNKVGRGGIQGGVHFGMAAAGGTVFVPVSDMIYAEDAEVYTDPAVPGLYALDIVTSDLLWSWKPTEDTCNGNPICDPGLSAPPTIIGDYVLAGALDGWLRVHNRHSGDLVWSLDTTQPIEGINGVLGKGGSLNGTGPVAYNGRIYLASGYGMYDHMPGNVLIVLQEKQE